MSMERCGDIWMTSPIRGLGGTTAAPYSHSPVNSVCDLQTSANLDRQKMDKMEHRLERNAGDRVQRCGEDDNNAEN